MNVKIHELIFTVVICFGISLSTFSYAATYGGGIGTAEHPYQIWEPNQLNEIGLHPEDWGKHFVMYHEIDMSGYTGTQYNIIGNSTTKFTGTFNGMGHNIHNLTYTTTEESDYAGLFGYIEHATIKYLGVEDITLSTGGSWVGGLVGINRGGTIDSCHVTGSVSGASHVGGLTGDNCDSDTSHATLFCCYTGVTVSGSNEFAGGLAGYNSGFITLCYSLDSVSGNKKVGGLAGENSGTISSCYAMGSVIGTENIAGLCGYQTGQGAQIVNCFWNEETSGLSNGCNQNPSDPGAVAQVQGKTTAEMLDTQTYLDAGWDFMNETSNGTCNFWMPSFFGKAPEFSHYWGFIPDKPAGNGTEENPYLITDANDLGTIWFRPTSVYRLANNINLSGITWSMTPIPYFEGVFDGDGHRIQNLLIENGGCVGLFGRINGEGVVEKMGLESNSITGTSFVGGIAGHNRGTISSCYVNGVVSGNRYVGGITGENFNWVTDCYAVGNMTGNQYVGGLVGSNKATISACWASAVVSAASNLGGLVGDGYCGIVNYSFWDIGGFIPGIYPSGSSGGKGLSSAQMKNKSIFQNANWAGRDWVIEDGVGYPRLNWEGTGGVSIPAAPSSIPDLTGSGTAEDPYLITTPEEFAKLSWYTNALSKHYELTADLDMTGVTLYPFGDLGRFNGVFDGNDFTIRNVVISQTSSDFVALFGHMGSSGEIKNLHLEDVQVAGRDFTGGLIGWNREGHVNSCTVTGGQIYGDSDVGGLAGLNGGGDINGCNSVVIVSGSESVGGLAGWNRGIISDSFASGTTSGNNAVGGLSGCNWGGIIDSYSTGTVNGTGNMVGGLVGWNYKEGYNYSCYASGTVVGWDFVGGLTGWNGILSEIHSCYATCSVEGNLGIGGLVGENKNMISSSFSTGTVTGDFRCGGLVGESYATIESCYAMGDIIGGIRGIGGLVGYSGSGNIATCYSTGAVSGTTNIGGFAGCSENTTFTACKWDVLTSGTLDGVGNMDPDPNSVLGEETFVLQKLDTYTFDGWDFTNETANGTNDYWRMCTDDADYPRLNWESTSGDFACPDGVNIEDLDYYVGHWLMNDCTIDNNYCGGADLNYSGTVDLADWAIVAENWLSQ